jgi:parvulin-like peptidyl-prolyl isomerase
MKRLLPALLLLLAAVPLSAQTHIENGIAVIVNDKVITIKDVNVAIRQDAEFLRERYRNQPEVFDAKLKVLQEERIEAFVENELVLHEFESLNRPLPESYVENRINQQIKEYGDRLTLTKSLQAEGFTFENFRQKVREKTILDLMWNIKVPRDPVISPTRIENYYLTNQDKFKLEDRVKLRMIVLTNRPSDKAYSPVNMAQEIAKKIDDGAPFADMARIYSNGSQAPDGGDWGWVERKVLREDLAKVAFSLKPGQRSDCMETPSGVYLMLVEQTEPAHVRSLSEVRDEIETTLKTEETKRLRQQFVDRLRKKSFIRYF